MSTFDLTDPADLAREHATEPDPWGLPGATREVGQDTTPVTLDAPAKQYGSRSPRAYGH